MIDAPKRVCIHALGRYALAACLLLQRPQPGIQPRMRQQLVMVRTDSSHTVA
ncbi:hypothetical protein J4772_29935 [Cohnella sp. LGH]|uniref:hypothetical protein n=1 Tax=Cohnella sp. LGH TaxID=1619153 RepID=UPI001ADAE387|nr:hypothetical protein [Cohnella sp. LGH]QTH41708.1 hypothetical protein J4772_29935 [Cohnella sp. LGH]